MQIRPTKLLSSIVLGILHVYTALIVLIIAPFAYLRIKSIVKTILHFWAKSVFWIMGKKLRIYGRENYAKEHRYIIIANHSSLFDIMAIMAFSPEVAWFGHYRLMKVPVFNQILKMINYIPLKPKSIRNTKLMLKEIIQKSKEHSIAIFPEGTRTLDGKIGNFYKGFVHVIKESDIDVLPVTLNGFYRLKPKNRSYIDFSSKLSMEIHKPFESSAL